MALVSSASYQAPSCSAKCFPSDACGPMRVGRSLAFAGRSVVACVGFQSVNFVINSPSLRISDGCDARLCVVPHPSRWPRSAPRSARQRRGAAASPRATQGAKRRLRKPHLRSLRVLQAKSFSRSPDGLPREEMQGAAGRCGGCGTSACHGRYASTNGGDAVVGARIFSSRDAGRGRWMGDLCGECGGDGAELTEQISVPAIISAPAMAWPWEAPSAAPSSAAAAVS